MFTDINLFKKDVQDLFEELKELEFLEVEEKIKKEKEITNNFKDKARKYLPTCLNIINTNFGCQFSLYKMGKDFNSSFKVIETNVRKSREEVEFELNNYKNSIDFNSLDEKTKGEITLAQIILTTYVSDALDINVLMPLNNEQKETNTIINSNETNSIDNGFNFGLNETSVSSVNTYDNLYNNVVTKPDNIPVETKDAVDNTNFSMDIFYNGGQ